ncbi:type I restriction enzyme HsdR N-terminal domain-containing protein [Flavobacteriaceae bacterium]|nr:type I restriction enzyme HsdR N-terminal domain-containing protein [Flavobacteriaceae bacterium]
MGKSAQLIKSLNQSLSKWDLKKAIKHSTDETNTRDFLIHPFLELLNYKRIDDFTHEYVADITGKRGRKVDVAITVGKKEPSILVECKKAHAKLTDNNFRQLNEYMIYSKSALIGILTNGIKWNFYLKGDSGLNHTPFFQLDITDYSNSDLEILSMFIKNELNLKAILERAKEVHFLEKFDNAFYAVLKNPTDKVLKSIYDSMGGKVLTQRTAQKITELINSFSLKTAYERMIIEEAKQNSSGIVTTDEEYKAFNVVKTMLAMSAKFKNIELERISFRDKKGAFNILVDDNQRKMVCSFIIRESKSIIKIGNTSYDIDDVTVSAITKHKKEIINSAVANLK